MGPLGGSLTLSHGRHPSSGHDNSYQQHHPHPNGLPERPSTNHSRYPNGLAGSSSTSPTSLAPPTGPASSRNSTGGREGYYSHGNEPTEGYPSRGGNHNNSNGTLNKTKSSFSPTSLSSSSGQGLSSIPPTRIGFGSNNNVNGSGPRGNSGSGRGSFFSPDGPSAGGRSSGSGGGGGSYYHGPPSMSLMGEGGGPLSSGRGMPFNRNTMPMNHGGRGLMQPSGRPGFGGGGGRGGGPPDRPMTSGRPDDWSRRRSRA
jgi:hypothetical protein